MPQTIQELIDEFVNRIRILHSLDSWELEGLSDTMMKRFLTNPVDTLIRMDDTNLSIVWRAMMKREQRS